MGVAFHWLGCGKDPTTSVVVCLHCDSNDAIDVTCNGVTVETTPNTAVNDGNVSATFTGLEPGQAYPVTIEGYGTHIAKTCPTDRARIAFASCIRPGHPAYWALRAAAEDVDLVVISDDWPYTNNTNGSTYTDTSGIVSSDDAPTDVANYHMHYRRERAEPHWRALVATGAPSLYMWGDHELPDDNWSHNATDHGFASQADADAAFNAARTAAQAWMIGNPPNDDAGVTAQKPAEADAATPASQYPALYTRAATSLWEAFLLDCTSHRSRQSDADNGAQDPVVKEMLGSVQQSWLAARAAASAATWKLVILGKYLFELGSETSGMDRFSEYPSARAALLDALDGISGCFSIAGDRHIPNVAQVSKASGSSWDHVCVTACPAGVDIGGAAITHGPHTLGAYGASNSGTDKCWGLITLTASEAKIELRRVLDDGIYWTGHIDAGQALLRGSA